MKYNIDYTLYLVTDSGMAAGTLEDVAAAAIRGGVTLVQLREKTAESGDIYRKAQALKKVTDYFRVPLIIDDRVDIMLAVGASGVHVGQSDIPAAVVRRMIGEDKILGVSAATVEEAKQAERDGADYLGVGAVFPTETKKNTRHPTLEMIRHICSVVHIPVVAIGGIKGGNAGQLAGTGIAGAAVVSAIMKAPQPEEAARLLKDKVSGIL